jgi:hypothetical protein
LVAEQQPKKVAFLRNGMLITDEFKGLRRFSDFKEFVAVVECLSPKGNALLRAMEPPAHDDFQPERLLKEDQNGGRVALRELSSWIRDKLKQHARDPVADVTELDELAEFFGDEGESGGTAQQDERDPEGRLSIRARPVKRRSVTITTTSEEEGDDDGEGEGEGEGGGDSGGGGGGANDGTGGDDSGGGGSSSRSPVRALPLQNVRAVPLAADRRRIAFTPHVTGAIKIKLEDSGADANRLLRVLGTSAGTVAAGRIEGVSVKAGERFTLEVQLDRDFPGTIRVKADAV